MGYFSVLCFEQLIFGHTFADGVITWLRLRYLFTGFNPWQLPRGVFRADGGPKGFDVSSGNFVVESDRLSALFVGPILGDKFRIAACSDF